MSIKLADVLPSPFSFLVITLSAILGINLFKFLATKIPLFGLGGLTANA